MQFFKPTILSYNQIDTAFLPLEPDHYYILTVVVSILKPRYLSFLENYQPCQVQSYISRDDWRLFLPFGQDLPHFLLCWNWNKKMHKHLGMRSVIVVKIQNKTLLHSFKLILTFSIVRVTLCILPSKEILLSRLISLPGKAVDRKRDN